MKPSDLPLTWKCLTVGELLERKWLVDHMDGNHGSDYPRSEEFVQSGVPYISANSLESGRVNYRLAKYLTPERASRLRKGFAKDRDVLFAHNATVGPVALLRTDQDRVVLGTSLTYYRCDDVHLVPEYLKQFLESHHFVSQYRRLMGQSTRNQVPITAQRDFTCIVPPHLEQGRIASILSAWDRAIELVENLIAAKHRRLDALVARLITTSSASPIAVKQLAAEYSVRNRHHSIERVLSVTNDRGFVLPEDQFDRRVASADLGNYKVVRAGEYAYNPSRINVGSVARLDRWPEGVLSPMYVVFRVDTRQVSSDYFYYWLKSRQTGTKIAGLCQGSVRDSVSFEDFCTLTIPLPNLDHQQRIAAVLKTADTEIDLLDRKLDALRRQKKGLMQQLLTGKVRVNVSTEASGE